MKAKIKFKSYSSDKIYKTVIEIENKTNDILLLTGIEDINHT